MISIIIINRIRIILYNLIFNYHIDIDTKIGFRTIINVNSFSLQKNSVIGNFVSFIGPFSAFIGNNSVVADNCKFICGEWVKNPKFVTSDYKKKLLIGDSVTITSNHFFDTVGLIEIKNNVVIAGLQSQFWTHGAGKRNHDIKIESNCYVGSRSLVISSSLGKDNVLAAGSVLVKDFLRSKQLIGGNPAKLIKNNYIYSWTR